MINIVFIDVIGLTYDGSTLSKRGLGGSESAIICMSKELVKLGLQVTVYNDCTSDDSLPGVYDGVCYKSIEELKNGYLLDTDIIIASRTVEPFLWNNLKAKKKILWLHDTFCKFDELVESMVVSGQIDEIFTLSDFHTTYITNCDHGNKRMFEVLKKKIFQTRNGITKYIEDVDISAKDQDLFVFNASVTKGMVPLVTRIWPEFKKYAPKAKLKIIGGFYKFREASGPDEQEITWRKLVQNFDNRLDISFTGIITQQEIARILSKASFMMYPAEFPETFGISTLEALAYNVTPITCDFGALEETAIDIASYKIPYPIKPNGLFPHINEDEQIAKFVLKSIQAYSDTYLHQQKMYACNQVKDICEWNTVALQWKQHFYSILGLYLDLHEYESVSKINNRVRSVFNRHFVNKEDIPNIKEYKELPILVITTLYNAENYIEDCIRSVASQNYHNYTMVIIDDASTDNTRDVIEKTLDSLSPIISGLFCYIRNDTRRGALYNQYRICSTADTDEIVILLDGDDKLVNDPGIFDKYNNLYLNGTDFTYGSCWSMADNIPLVAQPYPRSIIETKQFRSHSFNWGIPYTHLRTFSGSLLKDLKEDDWKVDGNWPMAGGDTIQFYYLIEKATNIECVSDIVYMYNDMNPINDYKVNSEEQTKTATFAKEVKVVTK